MFAYIHTHIRMYVGQKLLIYKCSASDIEIINAF